MSPGFSLPRRASLAVFVLACAAFPAIAADSVKGSLQLSSASKPASVDIAHVYYITGPDSFAPALSTKRLVFATADLAGAIQACEDARCAMSTVANGMTVELEADTPMARWWVHIATTQQSGMGNRSILTLTTDTPQRMAGTLTIDSLGVKTHLVFDASLAKAF